MIIDLEHEEKEGKVNASLYSHWWPELEEQKFTKMDVIILGS